MIRTTLVVLAGLCVVGRAPAASWADGLFQELSKDFGSVPRGPTLQHAFPLKNNTGETIRIPGNGLRVSCGCVTAVALKSVLQPGEETTIVVNMDTTRFTGIKSVTIHVQFDQPRFEEVRLWVRANGRDDVRLTPDTLSFGQIKRGSSPTAALKIAFQGDGASRITEVVCDSNYIHPAVKEQSRTASEVVYELSAKIRDDAPVGKWFTDVWLKTSSDTIQRLRVPLTVEIESVLSVSPPSVALGDVPVGGESERKVVVRGTKPFKITGVKGVDGALSVAATGDGSKPVHVLTVKLKPAQAGALDRVLQIQTDLDGEAIDFRATATVNGQ